jgi:hypothetical protein
MSALLGEETVYYIAFKSSNTDRSFPIGAALPIECMEKVGIHFATSDQVVLARH